MNKKRMGILAVVGILVVISFWFINVRQGIPVNTAKAETGLLEKFVEELGRVDVREKTTIFAPVSGYIGSNIPEIGSAVGRGDRLVEIESGETQALLSRRTILDVQLPVAESRLEQSRIQLANHARLLEAGAISKQEYESLALAFAIEEAAFRTLKEEYSHASRTLGNQQVRIRAPHSGLILERFVNTGDFVMTGTPVLMVGDPGEMYLLADILVSDIGKIQAGNRVEISNRNLGPEMVTGKVEKIYPMAFTKVSDLGVEQKRVTIEISLDSQSGQMKPGFEMDLKIITETRENALYIPRNAVFQLNGADHVFVVENGTARLQPVEVGIESGRNREILKGLEAGMQVVTTPPAELREGSKVEVNGGIN